MLELLTGCSEWDKPTIRFPVKSEARDLQERASFATQTETRLKTVVLSCDARETSQRGTLKDLMTLI